MKLNLRNVTRQVHSGSRPDAHLVRSRRLAKLLNILAESRSAVPSEACEREHSTKKLFRIVHNTVEGIAANVLKGLAPQAGLEPATLRLTVAAPAIHRV